VSRKKEDTIHHTLTCNLNKCCPIFWRPFLKRFALCYRTVICLSVLSLCDVGVLWPNGLMDQDETWHGGRPQPRSHCVRWGPSSQKRDTAPYPRPQFSAYVCCGQTSGWIKIPLGTEVDLGPGHIVLAGDIAPPKGAQQPLLCGPCLLWTNGRQSQLLLRTCQHSFTGRLSISNCGVKSSLNVRQSN